MATNLSVDVVGRREVPIFTWNPVEQMWVQENTVAAKPPPSPHDIHAIQTWFLDPDENEWIQTVLGPAGRRLAERWHGAHRVPESAVLPKVTKGSANKGRGLVQFALAAVVLVALIGGVAVAAPSLMTSSQATPLPSVPGASAVPTAASSTEPAPTAAPTPEPTPEPTPAPTVAPTARPVPRPAGPTVTLADGTKVVYTGPTTAARGGFLPASFSVIRGNGRPGAGVFAIIIDNGNIANRRVVTGSLNASGQIAMDVPTNVTAGPYTMTFSYAGDTRPITTITIR